MKVTTGNGKIRPCPCPSSLPNTFYYNPLINSGVSSLFHSTSPNFPIFPFLILTKPLFMHTLGQAHTQKTTFSRSTSISQLIQAESATIWALLTTASAYPTWSKTIISLEGNIQQGEKIRLVSSLDPNRTFKLTIKECAPNQKLVWGDAMGERSYTLAPQETGTLFTMHEKIGGLLFPLFANKIPSFDASFEQFTADLKKAAEASKT